MRTPTHRGPENPARDIADAAYADVTGTRHRTPTHYDTPREEEQA